MRFCDLSDRNIQLSRDNSSECADVHGIVGA